MLHINIQGLAGKTTALESFFLNEGGRFMAVCLNEHWLSEAEISGLVIHRYRVVSFFSRSHRKRRGVAIMLRDDYFYEPLSLCDFCVELTGEIAGVVVPDLSLLILSVYRSPDGGFDDFIAILVRVFEFLNVSSRNVVVAGDFNVCFNERDTRTTALMDIMAEYGLFSDFSEPTRLGRGIDNVFTSFDSVKYSVVDSHYSDHLGVVA